MKRYRQKIAVALIVLVSLWAILSAALFARDYRSLHRGGFMPGPREFQRPHRPLGASDLSRISSWMTFAFLEKAFVLPPGYLKDGLGITDPRYPNLTIASAAKGKGQDPDTLLLATRALLASYLSLSASSTPR